MAHINTVLQSINLADEAVCVDLFQRPDGSFGFEEFRRDPEDTRGWYAIGHHSHLRFDSAGAARTAARATVAWLDGAMG